MEKTMKLLFVIPRQSIEPKTDYNYVIPIGMGYIISVLKRAKYDVDIVNLYHTQNSIEDAVTKALDRKDYDFVLTGNTCMGYSVTDLILRTVEKHHSRPKTILGGLIITTEPSTIFEMLKPDFGVINEGEETIIELLKVIEKKGSLNKVKSIVFRDKNGETVVTAKRESNNNLDSIPFPDFEAMGYNEYLNNCHSTFSHSTNFLDYPKPYPLLGSRSCPFQCTFCYHSERYRERTVENLLEELSVNIKKYKINMVVLYDDCFTVNHKRVTAFCEGIKNLQKEVGWDIKWTAFTTVKTCTREQLREMKAAGCIIAFFGFESYSPSVLSSMRKPITPEEIDNAVSCCFDVQMGLSANFIFGDVAETWETAHVSLDYWKKRCRGQIALGFIEPYPGTAIYYHCLNKGLIKDKRKFLGGGVNLLAGASLNMTDKMSDKEFRALENETLDLFRKYNNFVIPNKITKTSNRVYALNATCPFCKKENNYKNLLIYNKNFYSINSICRHCLMKFILVSPMKKLAYRLYPITRRIKDVLNRISSKSERAKAEKIKNRIKQK